MDFCKFHDAKNANPAKNAGAILALPTGQGSTVRAICAKHTASSGRLDRWRLYSLCLIPWAAIGGETQ